MKEYRVETLSQGDSFHQMKLNEWAKKGWRCVSVTKTLSGAYYTFYLERDKPEKTEYEKVQDTYPGIYPKRTW